MKPIHILLTGNTSFKLVNFRATLINRLVADGHKLTALVPEDEYTTQLRDMGCDVIDLKMSRKGMDPVQELKLLGQFFKVTKQLKPDVVFGFTIKNNIYGSLAARHYGVPFLPNVTGLGTAFNGQGLLNKIVVALYKVAFAQHTTVFVQNNVDRDVLQRAGIISLTQSRLLPGSGVDLHKFAMTPLPALSDAGPTFLLVSRMLKTKGICEFAKAAKAMQTAGQKAVFQLLGPIDLGNEGAMTEQELRTLETEYGITYAGETKNVCPFIQAADCVVLPSYYGEGTPRSLLEAAAMGRPIITTNMPGCRDTVEDGKTGYIIAPRNAEALASSMTKFAEMTQEKRIAMGHAARLRATTLFDETIVVDAYLDELQKLGLIN